VVECRTSMNRHGVRPDELAAVSDASRHLQVEGVALHLPLDRPGDVDPVAETDGWVSRVGDAGLPTATMWVSHLSGPELAGLRSRHPHITFRPRVGTRLWLGDRGALQARGTVLDVEPLRRGQRCGYRQYRATSPGHLVVVSGGTAHGVALEAPKAVRGPAQRARVLALGTLEAVGRNLSPFTWAGRQRWFIEPPHMQVSLVFLPDGVEPPTVGEELGCEVRLTTTHPDRVVEG
ncbi:MAG: alanine racemase, partial [Actinomycetes bacterium]